MTPRRLRSDAAIHNYGDLNKSFYDGRPWRYFGQRLYFLALITADQAPSAPVTVGHLTVSPHDRALGEPEYPTPDQAYAAVECEVLVHHAAETLLRLIHAHEGGDPCPWLRMSEMTSFSEFKDWVRALLGAPHSLERLLGEVFTVADASKPHLQAWIHMLARHFLDGVPYNAAKHGMALAGASQRITLQIDGQEFSAAAGASVSWLENWRPDDSATRAWTRMDRVLSVEGSVAVIHITTLLMTDVMLTGRARYLETESPEPLELPAPDLVMSSLESPGLVLTQFIRPLAARGESVDLRVLVSPHSIVLDPPTNGMDVDSTASQT